jgi:hypothetical protein
MMKETFESVKLNVIGIFLYRLKNIFFLIFSFIYLTRVVVTPGIL